MPSASSKSSRLQFSCKIAHTDIASMEYTLCQSPPKSRGLPRPGRYKISQTHISRKTDQSPFPARVMLLSTRPLYPFSELFFPPASDPFFFSQMLFPRDLRARGAPRVGTSGDNDSIIAAVDLVGGRFLTVSLRASARSFISSLLRFFLPGLAFGFSTGSSALSGSKTLTGNTSFSCSCDPASALARLPVDLLPLVLTFSAEPVLRSTSTGRTGAAGAPDPVRLPRPAGTEDGPFRNLRTGGALSTGCEVLALTGLEHPGPRSPPTVVSVGAMLPLILVRILISGLVFNVEDVRTGIGLRGSAAPTEEGGASALLDAALAGDGLTLIEAAWAVLLALLGPLVEGVPEPDCPSGFAFFVSKTKGTILLFMGDGLMFSWLSNGIVSHAMAFLFFSDIETGESLALLLADDDAPSCDADDVEADDDGPGRFMSSHTEKPQSCGSAFSIRCRFSRSSSSVMVDVAASSSSTSRRCFFFPLRSFPSTRTFFATSSPVAVRAPSTTASVPAGGQGDSLPVDVLARAFVFPLSSCGSSVSMNGEAEAAAFGGSGGEG